MILYETLIDSEIEEANKIQRVRPEQQEHCYQYDARYELSCDNFTNTFNEKRSHLFDWYHFTATPKIRKFLF